MKKVLLLLLTALMLSMAGCASNEPVAEETTPAPETSLAPVSPQVTHQIADEGGMMKLPYQ